MNCLTWARRTSADFSISATRMICEEAALSGRQRRRRRRRGSTDLYRPEAGSVPGRHVLVEGVDRVGPRELPELLVHVVGPRPRVVAEPDPKVLDLERLLLVDLCGAHWFGCPLASLGREDVPD